MIGKTVKKVFLGAACILLLTGILAVIRKSETEEDTVRICCNIKSGEDKRFNTLYRNLKLLEKTANVEFINTKDEDFGSSDEANVYYVQSAIAQDADAIMLVPNSDQILPTVCRLCEEAEVYWGIYFRNIEDENIRQICEESLYYVGNVCEDEENMAYQLATMTAELGYQQLGLISTSRWDTTGKSRENGIQRALQENTQMSVIGEVRRVSSPEAVYECTRGMLDAYPEMDCIFLVGSINGNAQKSIYEAIQDTGREVGFVAIDYMDGFYEMYESGVLKSVVGLPQLTIDPYYLALKLINTLKGYPIEDCSTQIVPGILIPGEMEAEQMKKLVENENLKFFSEEFISENLLKWNNPKLDGDEFQRIINENRALKYSQTDA